ncbi:Undecaprenyl-phosphate alpha-N-acetylglucosaminephosphotransferase [Granulibacter bethesdensis]|nr:Undecaprenyl-phosphate alpha-N-acetylglucosaminephosphotransferase [Granulibacter bethesdensis]
MNYRVPRTLDTGWCCGSTRHRPWSAAFSGPLREPCMTFTAFLHHLLFCAALAGLSAMIVRIMITVRVMDQPDLRKAHSIATPKGGGVGIVVAFLAGLLALYIWADFSRIADPYFRGVIIASVAIAAVSMIDDIRSRSFTVKLGTQILAALTVIASGLSLRDPNLPFIGPVSLGWIAPIASMMWLIFATNAMNFIDGLNGLASGVSLIACLFLAWIAQEQGGYFIYFAALLLASGIAGFLPFNFPKARIFMGDVGSQFCGFVLAMLGIAASRFDNVDMSFLLVPMLLFGVLFDVAFTLIRRGLNGENVTAAHRGHLYQIASRSGFSREAVTLIHWGFVVLGGCACLLFMQAGPSGKLVIPALLLVPQLLWLGCVVLAARKHGTSWR